MRNANAGVSTWAEWAGRIVHKITLNKSLQRSFNRELCGLEAERAVGAAADETVGTVSGRMKARARKGIWGCRGHEIRG